MFHLMAYTKREPLKYEGAIYVYYTLYVYHFSDLGCIAELN